MIDGFDRLGTEGSSRRLKKEIKPVEHASEAILGLKPVTFHYKSDNTNTPRFGLIAEEVAEVNPDLVVCDKNGEIYAVRYDAVNAMLLNEFLKEHRKVEQQDRRLQEQEATIAQLKKELQTTGAQQQKQIEALTAGLQRVSAQLELNKPSRQTVLNNQ
jgi:septal ring factor EnvC (AmiA/AmiB activator)